jgi:hypothetical protein
MRSDPWRPVRAVGLCVLYVKLVEVLSDVISQFGTIHQKPRTRNLGDACAAFLPKLQAAPSSKITDNRDSRLAEIPVIHVGRAARGYGIRMEEGNEAFFHEEG